MGLEKTIYTSIEKELEEINLKVFSVNYLLEDGVQYLRIKLDKEGYVTLQDCVEANKIIDPIIEKLDLIKESYVLDVCSKSKEE